MSYERLIAEHGRIDMGLGRLQLLVEADEPDAAAITISLSDLSRELSAHLDYEDSFIYPRMIARLTERIRAENELLYTAALQAGAIRLRKAA